MGKLQVLRDLEELSSPEFVAKYIFDVCPVVFPEKEEFIGWKTELAHDIGVDPASIIIVGSASIGISMSPFKGWSEFSERSDIDVAVISSFHFLTAWNYLRKNGTQRYKMRKPQIDAWDEHRTRLIYWGTIATDKLLAMFPFGPNWQAASGKASRNEFVADREVKFRLYNDHESLRSYQEQSITKARNKLFEEGA